MIDVNSLEKRIWENQTFGKNGWHIIFIKYGSILLVAPFILLFSVLFDSRYSFFPDRVFSVFCSLLVLLVIFKAIKSIIIFNSSVKNIILDGEFFHVKTFNNLNLTFDSTVCFIRDDSFFDRPYVKLIFPSGNNLIIRYKGNDCSVYWASDGFN